MIVALLGNPNCGKTTLFNALTGSEQRVGNWPGVTVERKSGYVKQHDSTVELVDLPGTYSLLMASDSACLDERIACEYILDGHPDLVVNILDASNLERNLYPTLQLIEMQVPLVVVLNMTDLARQQGIQISPDKLAKQLGCPVVLSEAHKKKGMQELKEYLFSPPPTAKLNNPLISYPLTRTIESLATEIHDAMPSLCPTRTAWLAHRLLEGDAYIQHKMPIAIQQSAIFHQTEISRTLGEDPDILLADSRYRHIQKILSECQTQNKRPTTLWTTYIDNIVLNRLLGIPIFLGMMYFMFFFAINIGGAFQDFFDITSNTLFVEGLAHSLTALGAPSWLTLLLANGLGKGINTTVTFIPVIGAMFFFLALLEDSGYMARAAFVVDRFMRLLGLPGKSFVPLIVGFGCNVPAVLASRTLENQRDRILTVMMSPFMSCGARLAIYAVFTAAFFPLGGQNVVFVLYLTGIIVAMLTGWLLRSTLLQGEVSPLVMELPPYHLPRFNTLLFYTWQRLRNFILRAGKLIIPICILIGFLDTNALATLGHLLTPLFAPMGIHADNWPATVGLFAGVLAKEVVIGTLNMLYSQIGHLTTLPTQTVNLWGGLQEAFLSIPHNLSQLGGAFHNPLLAEAPIHTLNQSVYGVMYQHFDGQRGAIAYLLFVLLYFPCISTTAAMVRELNRGWAWFSVCWTTGIAYCVAVLFYQATTFTSHPATSLSWIAGIMAVILLVLNKMKMEKFT